MNEDIEKLSGKELIEEFEHAVKYWHYDPHRMSPPIFEIDDLKEEIYRRLENHCKCGEK